MELINQVKSMLVCPQKEWASIGERRTSHAKVFTSYAVPLALIPAVAAFIGYGLVGYSVLGHHVSSVSWGLRQAIVQYVAMLCGTYITAFIINALADTFGGKKDLDRAYSLVAFAYTPMYVGGVFYLLPSLSWLASLAGLYGLYLLYLGLQTMMKQPSDKTASYFVVSLLVTIVVSILLSFVLATILLRGFYY